MKNESVKSPLQPTRNKRTLTNEDMEAVRKLLGVHSVFIAVDTEEHTCTPETCVGHDVYVRSIGFKKPFLDGFISSLAADIEGGEAHIHNERCFTKGDMVSNQKLVEFSEEVLGKFPGIREWVESVVKETAQGKRTVSVEELMKEFEQKFPEANAYIEKQRGEWGGKVPKA